MPISTYQLSADYVIFVDTTKLHTLSAQLQIRAFSILDKVAFDIEGSAKLLAPVDTGALRASIYVSGASGETGYSAAIAEAKSQAAQRGKKVKFHDNHPPDKPLQRIIAVAVNYGIYPEMMGQPYMAPAVETHRTPFTMAWSSLFV